MLSPPDGLPDDALVPVLAGRWGVGVASVSYRPVGFGSHHWDVVDAAGGRWFATADDLDTKRRTRREPLDAVFGRLRASLVAAVALQARGRGFVVAPVPTRDGEPAVPVGDRFCVALYPFVDGQSHDWGEFASPAHRRAVLELVVAVHTAPAEVARHALADDFGIPHRDELAAALDPAGGIGEFGPYSRPVADLIVENAGPIQRLLARYDELVVECRGHPSRMVLTHGEPHPGNTMLTPDGWRLIDWDTALQAPPERDLWLVDPGDGSVLDAYADATGVRPLPAVLELYRIRWDLADVAVEVSRFRRRHTGGIDDAKAWEILRSQVAGIGRREGT